MKKALIHDGKVVQVEESPFEVHPSMIWVNIPDGMNVGHGWLWDGNSFTAPEKPDQTENKIGRLERLLLRRMAMREMGDDTTDIDQTISDLKATIQDKG